MRSMLRRFLSPHIVGVVRGKLEALDKIFVILFSKHRYLASFYYCFLSRRFDREHFAVLMGRKTYWEQLANPSNSSVMLRRNVHRVEKGLIMQPRRDVFGLAFIEETVACYKRCVNGDNVNQQELKWAHDVLSKYFLAVAAGKSEVVDGARAMFNDIAAKYSTEKEFSPYSYQSLEKASVSFEQFKQLCVQRRSVRWFKDQPVPRELINQALSAATLAPSACNRQPFEFFVFDKVEEAREIGAIPMGTAGFSHNFQCVLVVVGDLAAYPYERDRHVIYIDGSLASMQLMLALETLGLSSCVINWPDVENLEREMSKKLSLKANQRPLMVLSIGYADDKGMIPYSQKKDVNELVKEVSL